MITVYIITYNEEKIIQFTINHYRERFPNCQIVLYDNMSDDKTVEIAQNNNCEVIPYQSDEELNDDNHAIIKNTCWKMAKTDWVLICDADELLDIDEKELQSEEFLNCTIIKSVGYNMVNLKNNFDYKNIRHGVRDSEYDKSYLFNKVFVTEINYCQGAHRSDPRGVIKISDTAYPIYHYKYINPNYLVERYSKVSVRLSEENLKNSAGIGYLLSEKELRHKFAVQRKKAFRVRK
jgi:glycosyltransferase involved in cell wall biosynthesis